MQDPEIDALIEHGFVPLKLSELPDLQHWGRRYGVRNAPTLLVLSAEGAEEHRFGGNFFLPPALTSWPAELGKHARPAKLSS